MKDGITTSSGNSRYLKSVENFLSLYPNYEAFANALIAGTLPVDLNGINPAGWQQLGTSLSKANLLSDETESAIFGNAADRTVSQALAGLNRAANKLKLIAKYTVAGAYEWTCPEDGEYIALIIGGGGSGAISFDTSDTSWSTSGGASGFINIVRKNYAKNDAVNLVVGSGGNSVTMSAKGRSDGKSGGSSSFDSITANGGAAGKVANSPSGSSAGSSGAQPSSAGSTGYGKTPPFGGVPVESSRSNTSDYLVGTPIFNVFVDEYGLPVSMLCAGGSYWQTDDVPLANGKKLSPGFNHSGELTGDIAANSPTDCGAGGGSIRVYNGVNSYNATSGKGADGGVFIYKIQGATA